MGSVTAEEVEVEQIRGVYDLIKWGPTARNIVALRLLRLKFADAATVL